VWYVQIGQYLAKIWTKNDSLVFLGHPVCAFDWYENRWPWMIRSKEEEKKNEECLPLRLSTLHGRPQAEFFLKIPDSWKEISADIRLSRIIAISKNTVDIRPTTIFFLKYGLSCTQYNKLEKNCQTTTVVNKADKCSTVCTKHTQAAVSSAQQQNSSTSQVHNLCNSKHHYHAQNGHDARYVLKC